MVEFYTRPTRLRPVDRYELGAAMARARCGIGANWWPEIADFVIDVFREDLTTPEDLKTYEQKPPDIVQMCYIKNVQKLTLISCIQTLASTYKFVLIKEYARLFNSLDVELKAQVMQEIFARLEEPEDKVMLF